jgi:two-component system response regulator
MGRRRGEWRGDFLFLVARTASGSNSVNKALLLVEDNPTDAKLLVRAFGRWNFGNEISIATDGAAALELLHGSGSEKRPLPGLVLLDLKLPRIDGLEVLRRIREHERTRSLPVVVLTSSREDEDLIRSYAFGANAYVRKPVNFTEFVDAAKTLGLFWLVLNETPPSGA